MKITFPHMGTAWVSIKGMLEYMGLTVIVPPPTTKETLILGVSCAPEFACLPLKLNLGNLIEAKKLGADTVLMAGGTGPCRFGLYAQLEKEILADLGYEYDFLVLEPPERNVLQFLQRMKKLVNKASWWRVAQGIKIGYQKLCLVDELEKMVEEIRSRELAKGTADKIFIQALNNIDRAQNENEVNDAFGIAKQKLLHIPQDKDKQVLRIGLVGEIYTLLEPFASVDIEKNLGYLGAHVTRSLYLSDWVRQHLFLNLFNKKNEHDYIKHASPYLDHFVGGHGQETIGAGVIFAQGGYDGLIQVAPLTCMPEIVAHNVFTLIHEDYGIPVMNIYVDEQTGQEGIKTRLEAYIDLLWAKKKSSLTNNKRYVKMI